MDAGQFTHRAVGELLHPLPKGFGTVDLALRVVVQRGARRLDVGAADQVLGDGPLLVLNPVQLIEAPRVGLLQIDDRAEEVAGVEGIAFFTDGIQAGSEWRQFGT